jgi:hypothetical protein
MKLTIRDVKGEYPHIEYVDEDYTTADLARVIHVLLTSHALKEAGLPPLGTPSPVPIGAGGMPTALQPPPAIPAAPAPEPVTPGKVKCPDCGTEVKAGGLAIHVGRSALHRKPAPEKPKLGPTLRKLTITAIMGSFDALCEKQDLGEAARGYGVTNLTLLRTITNQIIRELGGTPRMSTQPLDPKAVRLWEKLTNEEKEAIAMKAISSKPAP